MTENGTWRLDKLDYFPCQCPKCTSETPKKLMAKKQKERETFLAEHNLYTCQGELRRIKQAIRDGRLWEHLEMRAHAHPALLTAVKKLKKHQDVIEKSSPIVKRSGLFFLDSHGLARPEVVHYRKRLSIRYNRPNNSKVLLLVPQSRNKPFHKAREFHGISRVLKHLNEGERREFHVCFYAAPFGIIPVELDEVYPLSQHETTLPTDQETLNYVAVQAANYIKRSHYETVIFLHDPQNWNNTVKRAIRAACKLKRMRFEAISIKDEPGKEILSRLEMVLRKNLSEKP
jgi:7-cyano-7-deazaguanine tRNA-ribosyltransferase